MCPKTYAFLIAILATTTLYSQAPAGRDTSIGILPINTTQLSDKAVGSLQNKYSSMETSIDKQSLKVLDRVQKQEKQLQKMMQLKDSMAARQLFANAEAKYNSLRSKLRSPVTKIIPRPLQEYVPRLDSLQTAFHFLSQQPANGINIPAGQLKEIQGLSQQFQQVQGRLQQAGELKEFISQREQLLKDNLTKYGLGSKLLGMNKEVYYYQQQLSQYKATLQDQQKLEETALGLVRKLPAFQAFMQKNSYIGTLFPMPGNYGTAQALDGLQTRASVGTLIAQRMSTATAGTNQEQYLQQQIQAAQGEMTKLKDKLAKAGAGNSDMEMPQFKPNSQKTKRFLQRIEYGVNLQNQQSAFLLPVTTDIAATAGYRFSDRATAGLGASYKLGWGSGWNHIAISNQGVGIRSYADIKAKGSIWITGGFEYNYLQAFAGLSDIIGLDVWQKSALLGLEKKYKIGKQNSNIQLLYDFLWHTLVPAGQAFKFRIGYTF